MTDPDHTEWNGGLFCEANRQAIDWQTGIVTCPCCDETFENPPLQHTDD